MKGEEEFFPKGSVWYCDQCKLVDGLEISVWVDPCERSIDHLNTIVEGGYEGCSQKVTVIAALSIGKRWLASLTKNTAIN